MSVARIPIRTASGTYEVYTRRAGSHARNKLLLLHGGPGATHEYFGELEKLLDAEVIYYDQLGCGASDRPADESLWTLARYVDEVEQVRQGLGLGPENFFLLGHSWGGILALEYALAHGDQLRGLIVANMVPSIPAYNRYLIATLNKELGVSLDHPEAAQKYYARYMCRQPWPEGVTRAFAQIDPRVAQPLRGTDRFVIGGELGSWDRTSELHRIDVPALIVHGGLDASDAAAMEAFARALKRGRYWLCPESRHVTMVDEPELFAAGVAELLATS